MAPNQWINNNVHLFKLLVDQTSDALIISSPETAEILYVNQAACLNLGYNESELTGMKVYEFTGNIGNRTSWQQHMCKLRQHDQVTIETTQRRKDGSLFNIEVSVRLISQADEAYVVSSVRDISERKVQQQLLATEHTKLETLMNALPDGLSVQSPDLKILYQNRVHRSKQGDHIGEQCYRAYHGKDEPCEGCMVLKSLDDGQSHRREVITAHTTSGTMYMEASAHPVKNSEGEVVAVMELVHDISEQKLAEKALQEALRLKSQFISMTTHELNTPLATILGYSEMLLNEEVFGPLQAGQHAPMQEIFQKSEALTRLINDILDINHIDSHQSLPLEQEQFSLTQLAVRATGRFDKMFAHHNVVLEMDPSTQIGLYGDPVRITQVLENLLSNAVKFSPSGGAVVVSLRSDQQTIRLSIEDKGVGMSPAELNQAGDPFYRANPEDPSARGLGLGLSIVRSIVRAHNGEITMESRPGTGTLVTITLPCQNQSAATSIAG